MAAVERCLPGGPKVGVGAWPSRGWCTGDTGGISSRGGRERRCTGAGAGPRVQAGRGARVASAPSGARRPGCGGGGAGRSASAGAVLGALKPNAGGSPPRARPSTAVSPGKPSGGWESSTAVLDGDTAGRPEAPLGWGGAAGGKASTATEVSRPSPPVLVRARVVSGSAGSGG